MTLPTPIIEHSDILRRLDEKGWYLHDLKDGAFTTVGEDVKVFLLSVLKDQENEFRARVKRMKKEECDCTTENGIGYHTKDCNFYPNGYNQAISDVLKALDEGMADSPSDEYYD